MLIPNYLIAATQMPLHGIREHILMAVAVIVGLLVRCSVEP